MVCLNHAKWICCVCLLSVGHTPVHRVVGCNLVWNYKDILHVLHRHHCVLAYFSGHVHSPACGRDEKGIHHVVFRGVIKVGPHCPAAHATVFLYPDCVVIRDAEGSGVSDIVMSCSHIRESHTASVWYTLCLKKCHYFVSLYNANIHESILIICFAKLLLRKWAIKRCFIFSPHLTIVSALPGKMKKTKIASFYSNAVLLHCHTSTSRWLNLFNLANCNSCSCCYMTL